MVVVGAKVSTDGGRHRTLGQKVEICCGGDSVSVMGGFILKILFILDE